MAMGAKAILAVFNGSAFEAAGDRKPSLIKLPRWSLNPWLCENSERAFTEGNRVLLAPRFPGWLAITRAGIGLERKVVLRSFYVFLAPKRFDTAKTHRRPRLGALVATQQGLLATCREPRSCVAWPLIAQAPMERLLTIWLLIDHSRSCSKLS